MAELKFDADKELIEKFSSTTAYITKETPSKEEIIQKIAENFSYNELVLATTYFMIDKTAEIIKENPMVALLGLIKDLRKED